MNKKNPADVAAELIKKLADQSGLKLVDDFDERIAEWRAYLEELIEMEMIWTTEFPTKPGYYWIRNYARRWSVSSIYAGPHIVEIGYGPEQDSLHVIMPRESSVWPIDHIMTAEWYGPIEPPE